jgi:predicted dehydrogenase
MTVQQVIKNNMLGRLVEFESNFMRYRNFIVQNTWKEDAGRGITVDLGSHMIDQALLLFGKPTGVIADIDAIRDNSAIDDYYNIRLIYPNVKVTLKASILVREQTPRYTLHGTLGSFLKYGIDPQEERLKKNPIVTSDLGKESEEYWGIINTDINNLHVRGKVETIDGCYMAYYNQIYDALCGKSTIPVPAEDGLLVIKVAEAALKSATSGHIEVI